MAIDPAWAGRIAFHELLFGTWSAYVALVFAWERVLGVRLEEWRYVLFQLLGASAFAINHYFQNAPFWVWLINGYTLMFLSAWWRIGIQPARRARLWRLAALAVALAWSGIYIALELSARALVERVGLPEAVVTASSFAGMIAVVAWRHGRRA